MSITEVPPEVLKAVNVTRTRVFWLDCVRGIIICILQRYSEPYTLSDSHSPRVAHFVTPKHKQKRDKCFPVDSNLELWILLFHFIYHVTDLRALKRWRCKFKKSMQIYKQFCFVLSWWQTILGYNNWSQTSYYCRSYVVFLSKDLPYIINKATLRSFSLVQRARLHCYSH